MNIKNFSVSQVDTHLDCARKWFFKSVLKIPDPPNEAAIRGISIHAAAENVGARLSAGAAVDEALAAHDATDAPWIPYVRALAASKMLPNPGEPHAREHRFEIPTHTGIPLIGVIDLILDERSPIHVIDFKSVSDVRYAKTPQELASNLQLAVYAHYIFQNIDDDLVRASLAYVEAKKQPLKTKPPRTLNVHVDFDRDRVRRIWEGDLPFGDPTRDLRLPVVLDRMLDIVTNCDDFNDVPPTTTTCTKYGGCPFRTRCGLSPFAGIASARNHEPLKRIKIGEANMGFLDKNKTTPTNGTNGSNGTTGAAPAAAKATTSPTATKGTGFLSRVGAAAPVTKPTEAERQAKLDQDFGPKVPTGVVPSDAPSRTTSVSVAAEEPEVAETPKKRGRPKKDVDDTVVETAPAKKASTKQGFTIMIDCMTTKGAGGVDPTMLDDFFSTIEMELNDMAASEENLPSYWLLPFAGQKAALAMKVQERIAKGLPPVMIVRSSSNAAREVLPFLLPHATQVIQALRG